LEGLLQEQWRGPAAFPSLCAQAKAAGAIIHSPLMTISGVLVTGLKKSPLQTNHTLRTKELHGLLKLNCKITARQSTSRKSTFLSFLSQIEK